VIQVSEPAFSILVIGLAPVVSSAYTAGAMEKDITTAAAAAIASLFIFIRVTPVLLKVCASVLRLQGYRCYRKCCANLSATVKLFKNNYLAIHVIYGFVQIARSALHDTCKMHVLPS
jgi:hypothetical protein